MTDDQAIWWVAAPFLAGIAPLALYVALDSLADRASARGGRPRYRVKYEFGRYWPQRRWLFGWLSVDCPSGCCVEIDSAIDYINRDVARRQPAVIVATMDAQGQVINPEVSE